ncbi:MAG: GNAT family N-acetyltransferase [bacterium]|nr:GNAT family N-acetyltransferase [bacterium]
MRIRAAHPSDSAELAELFTSSVHGLASPHYDANQLHAWAPNPPDPDYWRRRLAAVDVRVAEIDGQLAGFVGFHDNGHIDLMFVHPDHARSGVATALLKHAEHELAAVGVVSFHTEASEAARPFFERQGFEVERHEFVDARGVEIGRYVMRKRKGSSAPGQ